MMRWRLFTIYVAVTVALVAMCLSDSLFGKGDVKKFLLRLLLCFIWPLAALSRAGRNLLFKLGEEL